MAGIPLAGGTSVADTNELVERLSAAAGMIMEDSSPVALTPLPRIREEAEERLRDLDQACRDAGILVQAAQVLSRREIR
jgi:hypothetical protein